MALEPELVIVAAMLINGHGDLFTMWVYEGETGNEGDT